jgi:hypothetical protein
MRHVPENKLGVLRALLEVVKGQRRRETHF